MPLALYRKYRPQCFGEIINQVHIKTILENEVAQDKVAHAYLFSGPRGTGKTSLARILAKAVNCVTRRPHGVDDQSLAVVSREHTGEPCNKCMACTTITAGRALDIMEIDAASYTGVDNVRDTIVETAKFAPNILKYKLFIIDEAHMLSVPAWNALLKIMEEPPAHVIFVLATTEVHKVPATILSRCQRFDFHRIKMMELVARLQFIAEQEKIKVAEPVLETVARLAEGGVRDAESLLEKLFSLGETEITEAVAALVLPRTSLPMVYELLEAIAEKSVARALNVIAEAVEQGVDLVQFAGDLLETLRGVLLFSASGSWAVAEMMSKESQRRLEQVARALQTRRILQLIELFSTAKLGLKNASIPALPLEVAAVEGCGIEDSAEISRPASERISKPVPDTHLRTAEDARKENHRVTMADIKNKWPEVMKQAQVANHSLPFLLSTSELLDLRDNVLQIGLQYPLHCDKINELKSRAVLEKILAEVYGIPLKISGVVHLPLKGLESAVEDVISALGGRVIN